MRHTKGPWVIDKSHEQNREGIQVWADDVIICDVVPDQHGNEEANSHLIKAAPDMLEALSDLLLLIVDGKVDENKNPCYIDEVRRGLDVLAKVEGLSDRHDVKLIRKAKGD